jgi:hypothetical protein
MAPEVGGHFFLKKVDSGLTDHVSGDIFQSFKTQPLQNQPIFQSRGPLWLKNFPSI